MSFFVYSYTLFPVLGRILLFDTNLPDISEIFCENAHFGTLILCDWPAIEKKHYAAHLNCISMEI